MNRQIETFKRCLVMQNTSKRYASQNRLCKSWIAKHLKAFIDLDAVDEILLGSQGTVNIRLPKETSALEKYGRVEIKHMYPCFIEVITYRYSFFLSHSWFNSYALVQMFYFLNIDPILTFIHDTKGTIAHTRCSFWPILIFLFIQNQVCILKLLLGTSLSPSKLYPGSREMYK